MGAVTITVDSTESFKQRVKAAFAGKRQQERISFESFDLLWKVLAPNRMALVQTLTGAGPVTLREAARRVGRDVRAVPFACSRPRPDIHVRDPKVRGRLEAAPHLRAVPERQSYINRMPVSGSMALDSAILTAGCTATDITSSCRGSLVH